MRVLIADDSRVERARVKQILLAAGHEVVAECANGEEAVRLAEQHQPDLCVLDVVMPRMTGDAAGAIIAQMPSAPSLIFATKNSQRALLEVAARLGALLAVKPYNEPHFLACLESIDGKH